MQSISRSGRPRWDFVIKLASPTSLLSCGFQGNWGGNSGDEMPKTTSGASIGQIAIQLEVRTGAVQPSPRVPADQLPLARSWSGATHVPSGILSPC